jgi:hypothetical protein
VASGVISDDGISGFLMSMLHPSGARDGPGASGRIPVTPSVRARFPRSMAAGHWRYDAGAARGFTGLSWNVRDSAVRVGGCGGPVHCARYLPHAEKLGLKSRTGIVRYALQRGWLSQG